MRFAIPLLTLSLLAAPSARLAAQATPAPEPSYVTEKGFRSKVFEVKHRDPHVLSDSVRALGSGFKGSVIGANRDLSTITVRDFPENVAAIEEALKRLDTPESRQPDVRLRLYVLVATPFPQSGPIPEELKEVIPALRTTLSYKGFEPAAVFEQRVKDGTRDVEGSGVGNAPTSSAAGAPMQIEYKIRRVSVDTSGPGPALVRLEGFSSGIAVGEYKGRAQIRTDLTVKDGEKVVVGTSALKDKGLIVVVVASIQK
jgi:hypothetical protein